MLISCRSFFPVPPYPPTKTILKIKLQENEKFLYKKKIKPLKRAEINNKLIAKERITKPHCLLETNKPGSYQDKAIRNRRKISHFSTSTAEERVF